MQREGKERNDEDWGWEGVENAHCSRVKMCAVASSTAVESCLATGAWRKDSDDREADTNLRVVCCRFDGSGRRIRGRIPVAGST
eukprot:2232907-Rhodomonas_salina.2